MCRRATDNFSVAIRAALRLRQSARVEAFVAIEDPAARPPMQGKQDKASAGPFSSSGAARRCR